MIKDNTDIHSQAAPTPQSQLHQNQAAESLSSNKSQPNESRPEQPLHIKKPEWLKTKIPTGQTYFDIKRDLRSRGLFTVCEEAKCPNIGECWNYNTATFMVLGDTCTRACRFCNIKTGDPQKRLDPMEPMQTAESAKLMKLKYVVITMVDRDDLPDGGSTHVADVISKVRELNPGIKIEVLAGDFRNLESSIKQIVDTRLEVYAHNIETVERLSPRVRDARAAYRQSLETLRLAKELGHAIGHNLVTKSALMVGLGETEDEVIRSLHDLREYNVDAITIGQYMRPSKRHLSIKEFVKPEVFKRYEDIANELGFIIVASGPLVRSSYRANEYYERAFGSQANNNI